MKQIHWNLLFVFFAVLGTISSLFPEDVKSTCLWFFHLFGMFFLGWMNSIYVTSTHDPKGSAIISMTFIFCAAFIMASLIYPQFVYQRIEMIAEEKQKTKDDPNYIPNYNLVAFSANRIKRDINLKSLKIANFLFTTVCFFTTIFVITTITTPITLADIFHRRVEALSVGISDQEKNQLRTDWVLIHDKASYDAIIEFTRQLAIKYKLSLPHN